jgi:uncharacterized protein (DUF302 family)
MNNKEHDYYKSGYDSGFNRAVIFIMKIVYESRYSNEDLAEEIMNKLTNYGYEG